MTDTITLTVTVSVPIVAQLLVSTGSLASVLLAGRRDADARPRHGVAPWLLLIAAHGTFLAYVLATGQPGFLPLNVGMILAGLYNLRATHVTRRRRPEPELENDTTLEEFP